MNIKATDEWVEHIAVQLAALHVALQMILKDQPELRARILAHVDELPHGLLATRWTDQQIDRIVGIVRDLADPLRTSGSRE